MEVTWLISNSIFFETEALHNEMDPISEIWKREEYEDNRE